VATNLQQEPTLAGQFFVEQYGLARWDAQRVEATIDFAERWSKLHHAPVYCGEFGVAATERTRLFRINCG
jgi:endoglucanase